MDNIDFGKLITILRKKYNITQKHLADILGVSPTAISKWENGKNLPNSDIMSQLCDFFHITHDDMFNPTETIQRIQNEALDNKNTIISNTSIEIKPSKKKWYKTKKIFPLLGIIFLVVTVATVFIIRTTTPKVQNCQFYAIRICTDYYWNNETVYEMAFISDNTYDYSIKDAFVQDIYSNWLSNADVPQHINTLKISFFSSESAASEWLNPYHSLYLQRK